MPLQVVLLHEQWFKTLKNARSTTPGLSITRLWATTTDAAKQLSNMASSHCPCHPEWMVCDRTTEPPTPPYFGGGFFEYFGLYFFEINYNDVRSSIHFIHKLMPNSNINQISKEIFKLKV
jgi:hypothetical protein